MSTPAGDQKTETSKEGEDKNDEKSVEPQDSLDFDDYDYDDPEIFLNKLRDFKPQSLGCLEARRKSSSALIFPNPKQACMGPSKCPRYPHDIKPTPSYWIECHGPGIHHGKTGSTHDHHAHSPSMKQFEDSGLQREGSLKERFTRQTSDAGQFKAAPSKLIIDRPNRTGANQQLPTTPTADRIITRYDSNKVEDSSDCVDDTENRQIRQKPGLDSASQDQSKQSGDQTRVRGETRKRLSKRTMTRDDIDLHKPRRNNPNITITEPSFNQSTGGYSSSRPQRPVRQSSQSGEGGLDDRPDSCRSTEIQLHSYISSESPTDEQDTEQIDGTFTRHHKNFATSDYRNLAHDQTSALDFKPYRQHRPSVIREDSDVDEAEGEKEPRERLERYCGLSTTTFHKTTYLQAYEAKRNLDLRNQKHKADKKPLEREFTQFKDTSLELISFEEENYEKLYYEKNHWNYFTNDELLGPVILSLRQQRHEGREYCLVLMRTVSYTLHGRIPTSMICAERYDREACVRELGDLARLKPPLVLGQLPSTPDELKKLDHIFIKTELKVGVIYIKAGQLESEESILANKEESPLFTEFLDILGDRVKLKGFDRYKGGLDTIHNLTGTESVYTMWRNIEIMFHVSTMLPHEENDPQKLQKKRHIGNDIVCVAFIESDDALFWPGCIKSYFLHTFITVRTSPKPLKPGENRKYHVSCVCRNEVQNAFKPYLVEHDEFYKSDYFREWLMVKIVNGERASYSAPKFARMQDRTRSQLLEDIITNLTNHLVTGQIPKTFRRGSWRPLGIARATSPLDDSMKTSFDDYDQLSKDFYNAFCGGPSRPMLCDVVFKVKDRDHNTRLVYGVRAIMALRSKIFLQMLYGIKPEQVGLGEVDQKDTQSQKGIDYGALMSSSPEPSSIDGKEFEHNKSSLAKRGSVGLDSAKKMGEKERRQSMLPSLSKATSQKPNYLTVPSTSSGVGGASAGGSGTSGMIKNVFNRLVSGNWSGWSGNTKGIKGSSMQIKVDQNKTKADTSTLAICKEIAKVDANILAQREFEMKTFDWETFQHVIDYIHSGQCKLSYETIPGLLCAGEHFDLQDLTSACFHHAHTHMRLSAAPMMMNDLYPLSCFYLTASQLLETILLFVAQQATEFFSYPEFLDLDVSLFIVLLKMPSLQATEVRKFQAMLDWSRNHILKENEKRQLQKQKSLEEEKFDIETNIEPEKSEPPEVQFRNLMNRLILTTEFRLDKVSNEDLVKIVLPTKLFSNDKIFDIMADESRIDS